jgi:hypothetical protein
MLGVVSVLELYYCTLYCVMIEYGRDVHWWTLVDSRHGYWNIVMWLVTNSQVDVNYAEDNRIPHNVMSFTPTLRY